MFTFYIKSRLRDIPASPCEDFFSFDNKLLDFVKDSRITVGHIKVVILLAKEKISSSDAFLRGGEKPPL